ncbi:MAG: hypothetical protein HYW25_05980 [Candidatus Aenigmarchaeota archaeon]|nr:hypothetical protein [Candidatus Aenigmarchaeota archaeon]
MIPLLAMGRHINTKPHISSYILGAAVLVIFISALGIFDYAITGFATATQSTGSNVTISGYIAIALSTNLSRGIEFGTITLLPANQTNATASYQNYTGGGGPGGGLNYTLYNASVSTDSNQNVDFCVKGSGPFATSGGANSFALANLTWYDNKTINNDTHPPGGPFRGFFGISATTSYVKGEVAVSAGNENNYRFWLNVSGGQAAGDYNTTISFRGTTAGDACGS